MFELCCKNYKSYIFVIGVEIYELKVTGSEINAALLCLCNIYKDFSVDNMKKMDYTDMSMIFQSIMMALLLLIFWISNGYLTISNEYLTVTNKKK